MKLHRIVPVALLAALAAAVPAAHAQQEEAATTYVYATYFQCEPDHMWLADMIMEELYSDAWDAAVEAGTIGSWGWMAHHTGGQWNRLLYYTATDVGTLLSASATINDPIDADRPGPSRGFSEVCGTHDDYIWQYGTGSGGGEVVRSRGDAVLSVYMECEMSEEARADELVDTVFAPIYDRYVAEGKIASWGWLEHWVGGKWRRLSTMTGDSHEAVLAARGAIIRELYEKHEEAATELDEICESHQDYLWNVLHETP